MPVGVSHSGERTANEHDASLPGPPARYPPSPRKVTGEATGDPLFRTGLRERSPFRAARMGERIRDDPVELSSETPQVPRGVLVGKHAPQGDKPPPLAPGRDPRDLQRKSG